MQATRRVYNRLKSLEGLALRRYWDGYAEKYTIGYGHTEHAAKLLEITEPQAEALLIYDVQKFVNLVNRYRRQRGYKLNQNQFDSLVLFTYNTGSIKAGSALDKAIRAGNWQDAAKRMLAYNSAGGVVLPGLVKRRQYEARLLITPYIDAKILLAGALFV